MIRRTYICAKCTRVFLNRNAFNQHLDGENHRIALTPRTVSLAPVVHAEPRGRHIIVALDASKSMAGTKIATALQAVRRILLESSDADRITLIAFDAKPAILAAAKSKSTAAAQLASVAANGTASNIRDAIITSVDLAAAQRYPAFVVVLTDGADTSSAASPALLEARLRHLRNVRITILGIEPSTDDRAGLQAIADRSAHCCELRIAPPAHEALVVILRQVVHGPGRH